MRRFDVLAAVVILLLGAGLGTVFLRQYPVELANADAVTQVANNHEAHLTTVLMAVYSFRSWEYLPPLFQPLASSDSRFVKGLRYLPLTGPASHDRDRLVQREAILEALENQITAARGNAVGPLVTAWAWAVVPRRNLENALRNDLRMSLLGPGDP